MTRSLRTVLAFKTYQNQAGALVRNYVLADPYIPYTSVLGGILTCKLVYDLTELISTFYFRSYNGLTKIQKIEWNNRGISTLHAIFISVMSLYFVFWSELFYDQNSAGQITPITLRNSPISTFALGFNEVSLLAIIQSRLVCSLAALPQPFSSYVCWILWEGKPLFIYLLFFQMLATCVLIGDQVLVLEYMWKKADM